MSQPTYQQPDQIPWNPANTVFPARKDLPDLPNAPKGAAWVWGPDDGLGRLNLVTPARIAAAASTEIVTGESARVDLPLNVPAQPAWERQVFQHSIVVARDEVGVIGHDDVYSLNTQSGTQWDGFRHVAYQHRDIFYNNTKASDITGPTASDRIGIQNWCRAGLAGRGVLLDYRSYAASQGITYDAATSHEITYADLVACGKAQGLDIRPERCGGDIRVGDFLFVRSGFVQDYYARSNEENRVIGLRDQPQWVGLSQETAIIDWLHDCYFAAVAGDAPAFEVWPTRQTYKLHEYLLPLWGVPIGEMMDLEAVSALAQKHKRWTFFFCTAPANCPGGVGSHVNGTVIF
ncbi:hypothetical protein SPI_08390 [Niveomyces insectorum RCEF 264]|uniref:Cyclase n=1 Tax=Niveomyces insectorum RCEF 264 TaxID=1081102 RepID=A0A162ICT3_9HYPO|nr:hypothetical protein SPI_08390 [Niveomyces insectorum RCEF 264]